ncbi:MAG: hypothetical protein IJG09_04880 [Methanobrevibacter sp.]|nr:hypothetical protein [Methanobrevibacter sp.]
MEFILNHKKYSILNHELYINYLMVDSYFRDYSLYDYDIHFDFLDSILSKDKIEFDDILEGTKDLEELIEREEINFLPPGLRIDEHLNGNFRITYQHLEFNNIHVGEAIPILIALSTLLEYNPTLSLSQINEELNHFIEKFRSYYNKKDDD